MTIEIGERYTSRGGTVDKENPQHTRLLWVRGTEDDDEVREVLDEWLPLVHRGLWRQSFTYEPAAEGDGFYWDAKAYYGKKKKKEPGDLPEIEFTVGTESIHVSRALESVARYAASGQQAPNFFGFLNVTQDKGVLTIEGADVLGPSFSFSVTKRYYKSDLPSNYLRVLASLRRRQNQARFAFSAFPLDVDFEAGEVRFDGAQIKVVAEHSEDETEIVVDVTHSFSVSENASDLSIGDITGIEKRGWDYLWTRSVEVKDENIQAMVSKPVSVHVDRVYPLGDFSLIRL